jgi:hypothetical protein
MMPRQTNANPSPSQRAVLTIAAAHPQGLAISFPDLLTCRDARLRSFRAGWRGG